MYCGSCGKELKEDYVFCPYCGKNVNTDKKADTEDVCPHCKGKDIVSADIITTRDFLKFTLSNQTWSSSYMKAMVCRSCGTVVRFYASEPETLTKK